MRPPPSYALTPGPQTRGITIRLAGQVLTLPSDVEVSAYQAHVRCADWPVGACPDPPLYELRRGDATLLVEAKTGRRLRLQTAAGAADPFAFLP